MPRKTMTTQEAAKAMAQAHTDLNVFGAIVELLEGGLVSADVQPDDFRIIDLAKRAQQRCLRRYDEAEALLNTKPK